MCVYQHHPALQFKTKMDDINQVKEDDDDVYREMIDVDKIDAHDPNATPLRSRTIRNAVSLRLFVGTFFIFFEIFGEKTAFISSLSLSSIIIIMNITIIVILILIHHHHHHHHS